MSILNGIFGKKKELKGPEIETLFQTISVEREPVIINTDTFKFVSDIMAHDAISFQLKNNISRDEVLYHLKGHNLTVQLPYQLTLYVGKTALMGLGMARGTHTLKFRVPESVIQDEHRGAYRISNFAHAPAVTFTTNRFDLMKAKLIDVSMTGAGIRLDPRWSQDLNITARSSIILDIRLSDDVRISTSATVRYCKNYKMGVQFDDLAKGPKEKLFKYVVRQRREEQRAMMELAAKLPSVGTETAEPPKESVSKEKSGKPTALIVGEDQEHVDFLTTALGRQFDTLYCSLSITDIRNHLELRPNLCLMQMDHADLDQVAQMKKVTSLIPYGCVLMFFSDKFPEDFKERMREFSNECFVDLEGGSKLMTFKKIQAYYTNRAPK